MTTLDLSSPHRASRPAVAGTLLCIVCATAAAVSIAVTSEGPFLAENDVAMEQMMAEMNIKPSGDVDQDFAAMMIPHHQGAIDMALAELRYGSNEQLRRLAQEIVVSQQQEIAAMRMAVGLPLPAPAPAPTQIPFATPAQQASPQHHMHD